MRNTQHSTDPPNYTIIAKTKDNAKLYSYGLLPNCAGYRISRLLTINQEAVFKIETSSNQDWNGKYSVYDRNLNSC